MNPLARVNHVPWKYIIGMNLSILVLAGTFVSLQPALQSTDNRPRARDIQPTPQLQVKINPNKPPELIAPEPNWAKIGDAIVVKGKNLGTVPFGILKIGEVMVPPENIINWQPDQIVFTVPEKSTTGLISLETQNPFPVKAKTTSSLEITNKNKN